MQGNGLGVERREKPICIAAEIDAALPKNNSGNDLKMRPTPFGAGRLIKFNLVKLISIA